MVKTVKEVIAFVDRLRKHYANQSSSYKSKNLMAAHLDNKSKRDVCSKVLNFINAEEIEKSRLWKRENLSRIQVKNGRK